MTVTPIFRIGDIYYPFEGLMMVELILPKHQDSAIHCGVRLVWDTGFEATYTTQTEDDARVLAEQSATGWADWLTFMGDEGIAETHRPEGETLQ